MNPIQTTSRLQISLRTTLIASFVVQIMSAVGLTGWLSFRHGEKTVNELVSNLSSEVTARVEERIKTFTNTPYQFLQINRGAIRSGNLTITNEQKMAQYFWEQTQISEAVPFLYFANQEGDFVGVWQQSKNNKTLQIRNSSTAPHRDIFELNNQGKRSDLIRRELYDPRQRPWYQAAKKAGDATWSSIYLFAAFPYLGITHAVPVYDSSKKFMGVLGADITLSNISDFLKEINVSKNGEVFIIENSGKIVASSVNEKPFLNTKTGQKRLAAVESSNILIKKATENLLSRFNSLENINERENVSFKMEGKLQFIEVTPIKNPHNLSWLMVVVIPKADFTNQIDINTRNTILLCCLAFVLATISGIITSQWITASIVNIAQASDELAEGNLKKQLKPSFFLEINTLSQSFNKMTKKLDASFESLRQSEASLEQTNQELEQKVAQRTASLQKSNVDLQNTLESLKNTQIELEKANKELELLAGVDALTQVANRRQFNQFLETTWQYCCREQFPLSLILGDIDFFKGYNDRYGHPAGDRCLFEIAQAMTRIVKRSTDLVARYGGEEFVIILPNTNQENALQIANLVQREIELLKIAHESSKVSSFVTMSIGISSVIPQAKTDSKMLIKASDEALYQAKKQGRNRIFVG